MPGLFSEYCGPDVSIWKGSGIPRDKVDELCKLHDQAYEAFKAEHGFYPYGHYIEADDQFLNQVYELWRENSVVSFGAITWFELKKRIAPRIQKIQGKVIYDFAVCLASLYEK